MTISLSDLEKTGAQIIQNVIDHEGTINLIAGAVGILPEVTMAEKFLPMIAGALQFMQQESGKGLIDVFSDFMSHITPGQANSPILSVPAAAPATDTQAPAG
jgi:hypothetical protein